MKPFSHIELSHSFGDIGTLFTEAVKIANLTDRKVSFDFNGVKVNITKNSTLSYTYPKIMDAVQTKKLSCFGEGW